MATTLEVVRVPTRPTSNNSERISYFELSPLAKPFIPQSTDRLPTLLVTNSRSLWTKAEDLNSYITDSKVDIACITETWIKPETRSVVLRRLNDDYHKFSVERLNRKGGGTLIMVKKHSHLKSK